MSSTVLSSARVSPSDALLAPLRRPRGRDLSGPELERLVAELAALPELWSGFVEHDSAQRRYAELLSDAHLTVWLICWMNDHDTGFHDHDVSAGAVAVTAGRVREERLAIGPATRDRTFAAGDTFHFSPADIHRVLHVGSDPAITLHAYSPPLARMGAYVIADDGVLARHPMSAADELRPLGTSASGALG
jgi:predicted metal-dependent enzyme (double-stranded beta helix superfamily)